MPIAPERLPLYPGGSIRTKAWRLGIRTPILERANDRCEGTPRRPHCRAEYAKADRAYKALDACPVGRRHA